MRILGLDFGSRTVGVAMSDPTEFLASPVETIKRSEEANLKATVRRIRELCDQNGIRLVVLGMPYRMDGSVGPSGEKVLAFKKRLERDLYQVEIALEDERLSTYEAEQPMIEAGIRDRRKRKETVDQLAASIILQAYLDRKRSEASLPGSKTE